MVRRSSPRRPATPLAGVADPASPLDEARAWRPAKKGGGAAKKAAAAEEKTSPAKRGRKKKQEAEE